MSATNTRSRLCLGAVIAASALLCAAGAQGAVNHNHSSTASSKDASRFMSLQEGSGGKSAHHGTKHHATSRASAKHSKHSTSNLAHNGTSSKGRHHTKHAADASASHA